MMQLLQSQCSLLSNIIGSHASNVRRQMKTSTSTSTTSTSSTFESALRGRHHRINCCSIRSYKINNSSNNNNKNKNYNGNSAPISLYDFYVDPRRRKQRTEEDRKNCLNNNINSRRMYHSTSRQEILPIIIVAGVLVGFGIHYSYRAVQRMKNEQEEYDYQLQQYERQQLMKYKTNSSDQDNAGSVTDADGETTTHTTTHSNSNSSNNNKTIITMGIDFGTCFMKLASTTYLPSSPITIQISHEGDRSIFNGIIYDGSNDDRTNNTSKSIIATGRTALERYYYPLLDKNNANNTKDEVSLPFVELTTMTTSNSNNIVTDVLQKRLVEVLDRIHSSTLSTSSEKSSLLRHVVTIPSLLLHDNRTSQLYQKLFYDCCCNPYYYDATSKRKMEHTITYLPDPIATVWGAQYYNIIPSTILTGTASAPSYCIIDVGSLVTQISIIQNDLLKHSVAIPYGGESIVEQLVLLLLRQQQDTPLSDSRSLSLLQYHARQAIMELSKQSRVSIHVPYIYSNPSQHHMDTTIARDVLHQAIEENIQQLLRTNQQHRQRTNDNNTNQSPSSSPWIPETILSPYLPIPNNLTTLFTSVLTHVIEKSGILLPTNINAILLVGGGSKNVFIKKSIHDAWDILTGGNCGMSANNTSEQQPVIRTIEPSIQSELTAIGAATLPPSFDYSLADGLMRRRS